MENDFEKEMLDLRKRIEEMHCENPPTLLRIITDREMHHRKVWGLNTDRYITLNEWLAKKRNKNK